MLGGRSSVASWSSCTLERRVSRHTWSPIRVNHHRCVPQHSGRRGSSREDTEDLLEPRVPALQKVLVGSVRGFGVKPLAFLVDGKVGQHGEELLLLRRGIGNVDGGGQCPPLVPHRIDASHRLVSLGLEDGLAFDDVEDFVLFPAAVVTARTARVAAVLTTAEQAVAAVEATRKRPALAPPVEPGAKLGAWPARLQAWLALAVRHTPVVAGLALGAGVGATARAASVFARRAASTLALCFFFFGAATTARATVPDIPVVVGTLAGLK